MDRTPHTPLHRISPKPPTCLIPLQNTFWLRTSCAEDPACVCTAVVTSPPTLRAWQPQPTHLGLPLVDALRVLCLQDGHDLLPFHLMRLSQLLQLRVTLRHLALQALRPFLRRGQLGLQFLLLARGTLDIGLGTLQRVTKLRGPGFGGLQAILKLRGTALGAGGFL